MLRRLRMTAIDLDQDLDARKICKIMTEKAQARTFIYRTNFASFLWPGGTGIDVAQVRVVLSDLALYFSAPMHLDGNCLALVLASSDVGPLTVVAQILEDRDLTDDEVEEFGFSFLPLNLYIGQTADLKSAKSFVEKEFPSWAQVFFFDEYQEEKPAFEPYCGPSSNGSRGT